MYMVNTLKQRPKLEPRFFRGTWLGKCTSTGESFIGVAGRVVRARTVRRLAGEARYDKELLSTVKGTPWNPTPLLGFQPAFLLPPLPEASQANTTTKGTDTTTGETTTTGTRHAREEQGTETTEGVKRQRTEPPAVTATKSPTTTTATERAQASSRTLDDTIHEGSASKSRKETTQQEEGYPKKPRLRINAVKVQLRGGKQITTATCEDQHEARAEKRLLEPRILRYRRIGPRKAEERNAT